MLASLLLLAAAQAAPTWTSLQAATGWVQLTEAQTDVGLVSVETHEIDGTRCYRASTEVHVERWRLVEVALDVASAPRWSTAGLVQAEVLGQTENTVDYWQYLDLPGWTLAHDRFWFQRMTHVVDGPSGDIVHWTTLPNGGPYPDAWMQVHADHPDAIEPRVNVGGWVFTGEAPTRATYSLCTGAGGALPQIVEEAATRQALPNTVADFVREAKRRAGLIGS